MLKLLAYATVLAALAFAVAVTVVVIQRRLMFQRWAIPPEEAAYEVRTPGVSKVEVRTADGETLKAYWKAPSPGAPVIVSFHGNAEVPQFAAERFSSGPWAKSGYGMIAIAYRGYPGSTGNPSEAGLLEDGQAAYRFAREHAPDSPVVVHGYSLGSGVAVATAAGHETLAVILEAPFSSMVQAARDHYPWAPAAFISERFRSDERIGRVRTGLLFITHGDRDSVVSHDHGERLAALRPDAVFRLLDGHDHSSLLGNLDHEIERQITVRAGGQRIPPPAG